MAIRYNSRFNKEIARTVANYNARLKRAIEKDSRVGKDISFMNVSDLKSQYSNRAQLKSALKSLDRFNAKSAEIIPTESGWHTQYQIHELGIKKGVAIRQARRDIERISQIVQTSGGQSVKFTRLQMGDPRLQSRIAAVNAIAGYSNIKLLSSSQIRSLMNLINSVSPSEKEKKFEQMRSSLVATLTGSAFKDLQETQDLITHMNQMSQSDFESWYESEIGVGDVINTMFSIASPSREISPAELDQHLSEIKEKIRAIL